MPFQYCHKALERIVLAGLWDTKDPGTVGLERDREFDSDRVPDSGSDLSSHFDCWDRHRLVGPAADIDSEGRGDIREPRLVDRDSQACWNRDFLVVPGSGTGYSDRTNLRRIAAAGFDRDHTVAERSLARMDILVSSDNLDWDTRFVDIHLVVRRKDWQRFLAASSYLSAVEVRPAYFAYFVYGCFRNYWRLSSKDLPRIPQVGE